jgi:iron complex transport system permease protein
MLIVAVPLMARGLDLLVLGEAEAFHMGVEVERLKRYAILLVSAITGAAVAVAGVIGFVGIVVPHLLRLMIGPGHRLLLPACVVLGAILMVGADTGARMLAAPAEVPIGILTAAIGAPFFCDPAAPALGRKSMTAALEASSISPRRGKTLLDQ